MKTYAEVKDDYDYEVSRGMIEPDLGTYIRERYENVYDDELNWIGFEPKDHSLR